MYQLFMFIAALFIVVNIWKQPKYSAIKKCSIAICDSTNEPEGHYAQ